MRLHVTSLTVLAFVAPSLQGQTFLTLPEASQRASVTQCLGITDITLVYHRPLINGRKV